MRIFGRVECEDLIVSLWARPRHGFPVLRYGVLRSAAPALGRLRRARRQAGQAGQVYPVGARRFEGWIGR
jgi:hypothetical protein